MTTPAPDRPTASDTAGVSPGTGRMPVLFLSHGAPPLADDARWTAELGAWSASLPRPDSILMVSAHWEEAPVTVSSTTGAPLVRDFWGFPQHYYEVPYDAPAAPVLADAVTGLLADVTPVHRAEDRGLDHGAYVPLVELYPEADVPVLQLSLPTLDPTGLFALGQRLAPLRDQGVLLVGSGFTTHNLRWFRPWEGADAGAPTASAEFDDWARGVVESGDVDAVLDWARRAPAALEAHPRSEHWAPLFLAMGAASVDGSPAGRTAIDGFWYGLSKRSFTFA